MKRKERLFRVLAGAYDWLRSPFGKLVLVSGGLLAASSLGYYYFELKAADGSLELSGGLFSALYWSVVTLTHGRLWRHGAREFSGPRIGHDRHAFGHRSCFSPVR